MFLLYVTDHTDMDCECAGTNVMVRCRSAFEVCKYADANAEASEDGEDHRQLFTVDEISEDVVLGSRLHAAGFKGVFVAENLATGEVHLPSLLLLPFV